VYSISPFVECFNLSASNIEVVLFKLTRQPDIVFVALYKPPTVKVKHLCDVLEDVHRKYTNRSQCVILGDFNIDWYTNNSDKTTLNNLMVKKLHYEQAISTPTTDYGSTLDLIFHNLDKQLVYGKREVYYSDHKMIWLGY
jgi:hypothetical protein